ncbi:MAG: T9SS type A sorting domain-containing protein [Paludibacteraceae bacterium]
MKKTIFFLVLLLSSSFAFSQTQKGNDIDGEATGDKSGSSVSMPDANTVAIGAPENNANGESSGQVRVYAWSGSAWTQKGVDFDGEAAGDLFGGTVSMPDANTLAIGAPQNDNGDTDAGQVKIFQWDGTSWIQKGSTLQGSVTPGFFGGMFGTSVSMPNANTVGVGASWFDTVGLFSGQVKVFDRGGTDWVARGLPITGSMFSYTGGIVKMPSENVIGVVTQGSTTGNVGMVRVFEWNGTTWAIKGAPISGENAGDYSGNSMDMPDENTIAIGAKDNDGSFAQAGHVRIFEWDGTNWVQTGVSIDGEAIQVQSGHSVSMPDANTVAIGAIQNDAVEGDSFKNEAGHVRIYEMGATGVTENRFSKNLIHVYPNPTKGNFQVEFAKDIKLNNRTIILRNVFGQEMWKVTNVSNYHIELKINSQPGIYFLEISEQNHTSITKVINE